MRRRRRCRTPTPAVWVLLLLPLLLAGAFWWRIEQQLHPIVDSYSENGAKTLATQAVNEAVTATLSDPALTAGLIRLQKNDSGEVSLLEIDAGQANALKLAVTEAVLTRLETADIHSLSVPLGTLLGSDLLSGRGPKLPIKVSVDPAVTTNLNGDWRAAGINQTAHTLRLAVQVDMVLAISGSRQVTQTVTCDYLVTETILVGKVPDAYGSWYRGDTVS